MYVEYLKGARIATLATIIHGAPTVMYSALVQSFKGKTALRDFKLFPYSKVILPNGISTAAFTAKLCAFCVVHVDQQSNFIHVT